MNDTALWVSTDDGLVSFHHCTEDEQLLLSQVIDIDGEDRVIVETEPVRNGSNRIIGDHVLITSEAWQAVTEGMEVGFV